MERRRWKSGRVLKQRLGFRHSAAWVACVGCGERCVSTFDGTDWIAGAGAVSLNGAGFEHRKIEIDNSVGSGASSTVSAPLPADSIVYGVTGRVLSAIGGATSLEIGVANSTNRYGSGFCVSSGVWTRGITGSPLACYSATDLLLTASGGNFDGSGTTRLAIHYAELTIPRP